MIPPITRCTNMRHTNIVFLLQMTKDYLDGKIDVTSYRLDFPYELETRYKKMLRENRLMAELIYDCLVEDGVFLYDELSDEDFEDQIRRQYEFVDDVYHGRTYM